MTALWWDINNLIFSHDSKMGKELLSVASRESDIEKELAKPPIYLEESRTFIQVGWQPPPLDFVKVNIDGAHNSCIWSFILWRNYPSL